MQDSIDCDSLFASWRITVGWISQKLSRWLHNLQNIVTFDFGMQFVKFLWDWPDAPQKNHVLVHCKAFSVARKFPCPALNAFVWNHCDHRDKERKCFPRPFLCISKHPFFRQCHYLHFIIPLKYWLYDCALHLHCILMSVRDCWVSVSLLMDPAHMHSH